MKKDEIISTLKSQYPEDTRKALVQSLILGEKENNTQNYSIIDQIFSYVLHELAWDMNKSQEEWSNLPLEIMQNVFPDIEESIWYQSKILKNE